MELNAQNTPFPVADSTLVSTDCLLGMQEQEWSAMGLTSAQIAQVQAVQTECKTACKAPEVGTTAGPAMSRTLLEKHQERIGQLISKEQYDKWIVYCKQRPGDGALMNKEGGM